MRLRRLDTLEGKICGNGKWQSTNEEAPGKCNSGATAATSYSKLSDMFTNGSATTNRAYPGDAAKKMSEYSHT